MPKLDKSDTAEYSTMKAFIIYQDFASAAKANAALQRSAEHSDVHVQWNIRPWRVDLLKFLPTASEALADATDAHLIVFAGCCTQSISHCMQDWLERWAGRRQVQTAALAVLGIGDGGQLSPVAPDLSQFAKRHGLSVIFDDRPATKHVSVFPPEFLLDSTLSMPQSSDTQTSGENPGGESMNEGPLTGRKAEPANKSATGQPVSHSPMQQHPPPDL